MAVNPKLILIASELAGNEKVRKTLLYVLFFSLGLIMLIFIVFIGLISGLLSIAQDNDLRNHWNYYRTSISEVFGGIEGEINSDVKSEVYDFMPEFSVNLSKATIANNFDNSSLILYDEKEIQQAQEIMQDYAEKLREITTEEALGSFISGYETELSLFGYPEYPLYGRHWNRRHFRLSGRGEAVSLQPRNGANAGVQLLFRGDNG